MKAASQHGYEWPNFGEKWRCQSLILVLLCRGHVAQKAVSMCDKYVFNLQNLACDEAFALMSSGEVELAAFQELIEYTQKVFDAESIDFRYLPTDPSKSLVFYLRRVSAERGAQVDDGKLETAWTAWESRYQDAIRNNPVLELCTKISQISEGHEGASWLWRREDGLREWVDAGADPANFPFDDRHGLLTLEFCRSLLRLRKELEGWVYRDAAGNIVVRLDE